MPSLVGMAAQIPPEREPTALGGGLPPGPQRGFPFLSIVSWHLWVRTEMGKDTTLVSTGAPHCINMGMVWNIGISLGDVFSYSFNKHVLSSCYVLSTLLAYMLV